MVPRASATKQGQLRCGERRILQTRRKQARRATGKHTRKAGHSSHTLFLSPLMKSTELLKRPCLHRVFILLAAAFVLPWLASLQAQPATGSRSQITLTPEQAVGGETIMVDGKQSAVALPAPSKPEQKFRWDLPTPLAPGWWEVTVEFAKRPKDSPRMRFFFGTELAPAFDLTNAERAWNIERFRLRLWTASPLASLEVRPQRHMPEAIRAVASVTFTPVNAGDSWDKADANAPRLLGAFIETVPAVQAKVGETISMPLPPGLPDGNWQIIHRRQESGNASMAGSLKINCAGGTRIEAPIAGTVNVFIKQTPLSLDWQATLPLKGAFLQYVPPYVPNLPFDQKTKPLPIASAGERAQLALSFRASATAEGNAVSLPLLPAGARMAVVTSWDDGAANDQRCAAALEKHGFRGTFFLMQNKASDKAFLADLESRGMEIASHSLNHPHAWTIAPDLWAAECLQMRLRLEAALGHPVISFAYPYGYVQAYDQDGDYVLRGVREAGYLSGRSTRNGGESITGYAEPLALVTDAHFLARADRIEQAWQRASTQPGGVFYLWGHSYEIRNDADWGKFDAQLARYGRQPGAWYATQGQLFLWRWLRDNVRIENPEKPHDGQVRVTLNWPKLDPWLARQVPFTLQVPSGVAQITVESPGAKAGAQILSAVDGLVTIPVELLQ